MMLRFRLSAILNCAGLLIAISGPAGAAAGPVPQHFTSHAMRNEERHQQHFVEFRARAGLLVGHTFIVYGREDHGRSVELHYAGIYPKDEDAGLIIGSIIPVPASVRVVRGDFQRPSAIYRRKLSAAEFVRLKHAVRQEEVREHSWHILFSNCNDFAIRIAKVINLKTPPSLLLPKAFVSGLAALNNPLTAAWRRPK